MPAPPLLARIIATAVAAVAITPRVYGGVPCSTRAEYNIVATEVTNICCDGSLGESCINGMPSSCSARCAEVLVPAQAACGGPDGWLNQPSMAPILIKMDQAVVLCNKPAAPPPPPPPSGDCNYYTVAAVCGSAKAAGVGNCLVCMMTTYASVFAGCDADLYCSGESNAPPPPPEPTCTGNRDQIADPDIVCEPGVTQLVPNPDTTLRGPRRASSDVWQSKCCVPAHCDPHDATCPCALCDCTSQLNRPCGGGQGGCACSGADYCNCAGYCKPCF